jgi:hypothetical protein
MVPPLEDNTIFEAEKTERPPLPLELPIGIEAPPYIPYMGERLIRPYDLW